MLFICYWEFITPLDHFSKMPPEVKTTDNLTNSRQPAVSNDKHRKPTAELALDKSGTKLTIAHYVAVFLWVGWILFYVITLLLAPFLAMYSPVGLAVIVLAIGMSVLATNDRNKQPQWGFQLGHWIMNMAAEYFGIRMYFEDRNAVTTADQQIFVLCPHDVLPVTIFAFSDFLGLFPNSKLMGCVSGVCFQVPFMRNIYTWCNGSSVDKSNMHRLMQTGVSPVVCPGGAKEASYLSPDGSECVLYMKNRRGLVRLALQYGRPIVPSFSFGLRQIYSFWIPPLGQLMDLLSHTLGMAPMVFFGCWGIPFGLPKPRQLNVVVGAPISVPKLSDPSDEDVEKYHQKLLEETERIFEEYKSDFGMGHINLRII